MKLKHDDGKGTKVYILDDGSEFVIYDRSRPRIRRRVNIKKMGE